MKPSEYQAKIQELYERKVGPYTGLPIGPRGEKVRKLFSQFTERKKVLDLGCANGVILQPFTQKHEIHGVDVWPALVEAAKRNGLKAIVHDLEGDPLPYADKSFDVVFTGETIEHQVDTDWFLLEVNRVLKTGGDLILTYPNVRTLLSIGMLLLDLPPMYAARYRSPHYRDFTLRTMKIALQQHGFALRNAIGCSFFVPKLGECCSSLATILPSWASTVIVTATKTKDSTYSPEDLFETEFY